MQSPGATTLQAWVGQRFVTAWLTWQVFKTPPLPGHRPQKGPSSGGGGGKIIKEPERGATWRTEETSECLNTLSTSLKVAGSRYTAVVELKEAITWFTKRAALEMTAAATAALEAPPLPSFLLLSQDQKVLRCARSMGPLPCGAPPCFPLLSRLTRESAHRS